MVFVVLITAIVSIPAHAKYSGGTGEPNNPYQIGTVADLLALAVNTGDYGKYFVLTADINLSGYSFTTAVIAPDLGTYKGIFDGPSFQGVFDGAGHKITNLIIDTNSAEKEYLGLFGASWGGLVYGHIKNLCLVNFSVIGGNNSYMIGGLVGYNGWGSSIINCYSMGTVTGGNGSQYLGGLVGYSEGVISECYSSGDVVGGDNSECLGGLAGVNSYGAISNCYSTAVVIGGSNSQYVGGLIGANEFAFVSNCYSTGTVSGFIYVGGLAGYSDHTSNCYFLVTSGPNNNYGIPLTDAQMKHQSNFAGWDFNNIWNIIENDTYPFLRVFGFTPSEPNVAGRVVGKVSDSNTSTSIANAEVLIAGMSNLSTKSDVNGHYEINGVPYNTLFTLAASAAGYKTSYTNNVQVTEANSVQTVDINLIPSPWSSLWLTEINPNPNSNPMKIMLGGIGHRYYRIVDENNVPRNGISVTTSPPLHGPFFSSGSIRGGVVDISVNSLEVSDGQTITVTHLNGIALPQAQQKSFVVSIVPLEQEKVWELKTETELGAGLGVIGIVGESEGTLEIRLRDKQNSDSEPELISLSRKALLGGGLEYSPAGVAAYCRVSDIVIGPRAGGGAGVIGGGGVRDQYGYDYDTDDLNENIDKLNLLLYPVSFLSPQLRIIHNGLVDTIPPEYCEELEAGIYIKGAGSAQAGLGLPIVNLASFGFADFETGVDVVGAGKCLWHKYDDTISLVFEYTEGLHGQLGAGAGGIPLWLACGNFYLYQVDSRSEIIKVRLEEVRNPDFTLKEIKLAFNMNTQVGRSADVQQVEFVIKGPSQNLQRLFSQSGIFEMLANSIGSDQIEPVEVTPAGLIGELDTLFLNVQRDSKLVITYKMKLLPASIIDVPVFTLDIGGGVGIRVGFNADLRGQISETNELTVEEGKVCGINSYPTETYSEDIYNPIDINLADVYSKALSDVGQSVIPYILPYSEQIAHAGQELVLNAGNSVLHIDADVLAEGQRVVNVFGAVPISEVNELFFGIGSIYRLESADLNIPSPAAFTITYLDSEVGSKDESLFRMYRWNDSTGTWEFVGGNVDVVNNTVTASINRFSTYAIGSRVEYGNFKFSAEPNAAPSDGNSIVTFTSEIIKYNDGNQVANGTLFTVSVSGGTIITADANAFIDGNQIETLSGILQFAIQAPQIGMKVKAEAVSINHLAVVTGDVNFVDSNAPQPPTGLQAQIIDGKILLSWNDNNEIDLAGYKIYFDDDANSPPYDGVAYYSGSNSPVDVADANSHFLRGLRSEHTYYITVTAYDMSGNESGYGNEIVFVNILPEDLDSDGMPDSWEIAYSNAANGLDPTANDAMADNDGDGMTNLEEYLTGHNPLVPDVDGDFNHDRYVNIPDLALFCAHWLEMGCSDPNWCEGTDLNHSSSVDFADFAVLAEHWGWGPTIAHNIGDFNGDSKVDFEDLLFLAYDWLHGDSLVDIAPLPDGDGVVNFLDFAEFAEYWLAVL